MKIGVSLSGVDDLLDVLRQLPPAIEQKVLAKALAVPSRKLAQAAKEFVQLQTRGKGTLAKSLSFYVRRSPKQGVVISLVGPKRGEFAINEKGMKVNATRYAHLIEYGHASRNGGTVAARPFLRPAIKQAEYFIPNDLTVGIWKGMQSELKLIRKSNRKKGVSLI